ncbi:MAG: 2-iminoacetate synthase ThiH [Fibromonadaceae bacterium]|jgi:2-iminoacetate synthase|nr:2-iminoacetate synthase ThiH [Fibromonadaceae bacterium]
MPTQEQMFSSIFSKFNWEMVEKGIATATLQSVERALSKKENMNMDDFAALISRAAAPYLENMAKKSREITLQRFGKAIQLYLPLYLSNDCTNSCVYCGFNTRNDIERKVLSTNEILDEIEAIKKLGDFEHILLVTGESPKNAGFDYLLNAVKLCHEHFAAVSIEVQPLSMEEYAELAKCGVTAVFVYQETYREETYKQHHPHGKKSVFEYRLHCPDRIGIAGVRKIGIGALLGLENWRVDSFFTALHLSYLQGTYWQSKFSISFPRLRPFEGQTFELHTPSDRELIQLICAYRICFPDVEISLSTRESANFRDRAMMLGLTTMSAGSRTDPGGYAVSKNELTQWEINDSRSPAEIEQKIRDNGYDPVWKDWDAALE